jgi:hypothetical protein
MPVNELKGDLKPMQYRRRLKDVLIATADNMPDVVFLAMKQVPFIPVAVCGLSLIRIRLWRSEVRHTERGIAMSDTSSHIFVGIISSNRYLLSDHPVIGYLTADNVASGWAAYSKMILKSTRLIYPRRFRAVSYICIHRGQRQFPFTKTLSKFLCPKEDISHG